MAVKRTRKPTKATLAKAETVRSQRKVMVFVTLVGALTATAALLLALAPAPLPSGATRSLFAISSNQSIDDVFDTNVPVRAGRWNYIYIHQSATSGGDAQSLCRGEQGLADHFVIGNGDGCVDGEIQTGERWTEQQPPGLLPGVSQIDARCVSICLIGNFNETSPTDTQRRRLVQLVNVLQRRLRLPARSVVCGRSSIEAAGLGTLFPKQWFDNQLLP